MLDYRIFGLSSIVILVNSIVIFADPGHFAIS